MMIRRLLAWWNEWRELKWVELVHTGRTITDKHDDLKAALDSNQVKYEFRRTHRLQKLNGNCELLILCRTKRDAMAARLML